MRLQILCKDKNRLSKEIIVKLPKPRFTGVSWSCTYKKQVKSIDIGFN
jgi:hypothetical protein